MTSASPAIEYIRVLTIESVSLCILDHQKPMLVIVRVNRLNAYEP